MKNCLVVILSLAYPGTMQATELELPDQKTAIAKLVEVGGKVEYGRKHEIISIDFEPCAEEWIYGGQIQVVAVNDKVLEQLKPFTNLQSINIARTRATDSGIASLAELPLLRRIDLSYTTMGDKGLAHLTKLHRLEELILDGTPVSDNGLALLKDMTRLRVLSLRGTSISNLGLANIQGLVNLEILRLGHEPDNAPRFRRRQVSSGIDDLKSLRRMGKMRELTLDGHLIPNETLVHLQGMSELHHLDLSRTNVSDNGLDRLKKLPKLEILALNHVSTISLAGWHIVSGMPHLRELSLTNASIGDNGLKMLCNLTSLEKLVLDTYLGDDEPRITDAGLEHVGKLSRLRELNLNGNGIGDAGTAHLKRV